jgi:general L-amino acid transport system permease protein
MLFKNTTFLLIIGIFEMLSTTQTALNNSNWLGGHAQEGYIFVGIVFWCCCFGMSLISSRIERRLDTQHIK